MTRQIIVLALVGVMVSGCATVRESRFNPFNWFGGSREVSAGPRSGGSLIPGSGRVAAADPRDRIQTIRDMRIERVPGGAIVRATGVAPTQGYYDAALVPAAAPEDGRLVLDFRVAPPPGPRAAGPEAGRAITAALFLSTQRLAGIRTIEVQGASNARASRR